MTLTDKLTKIAGKYHKSMVENVTMVLTGLMTSKTTNLNKIKDDMARISTDKNLKSGSYYQKLIRFFENYKNTRLFIDILLWVISTLGKEINNFFLDGTEWKIGLFNLHILVLAAQVNGVAVPVYFKIYQHKGVFSENERINFIRKAFALFDLKGKLLIADREFIGKEWFGSLVDFGLNFVIRSRKGMYRALIANYERLEKKALKKGYSQAIFSLEGKNYKMEMWRSSNKDEPIIYLITNVLNKKRVGKQYAKRWKIEYCFKHLKTNGFNLEDMSLTDLKKIRLMVALVVVAYILAVREGIIQGKIQKVRIIKYKNGDKLPAISIFRNGLQTISNQVISYLDFDKYLKTIKQKKYSIIQIV